MGELGDWEVKRRGGEGDGDGESFFNISFVLSSAEIPKQFGTFPSLRRHSRVKRPGRSVRANFAHPSQLELSDRNLVFHPPRTLHRPRPIPLRLIFPLSPLEHPFRPPYLPIVTRVTVTAATTAMWRASTPLARALHRRRPVEPNPAPRIPLPRTRRPERQQRGKAWPVKPRTSLPSRNIGTKSRPYDTWYASSCTIPHRLRCSSKSAS